MHVLGEVLSDLQYRNFRCLLFADIRQTKDMSLAGAEQQRIRLSERNAPSGKCLAVFVGELSRKSRSILGKVTSNEFSSILFPE